MAISKQASLEFEKVKTTRRQMKLPRRKAPSSRRVLVFDYETWDKLTAHLAEPKKAR